MPSKLRLFTLLAFLVLGIGVACDDPSNPDPDPDPDANGEEIAPEDRIEAFAEMQAELEPNEHVHVFFEPQPN